METVDEIDTKQYIRAGIIGSAGYTGGELIRLLIHHPKVQIVYAHSVSNAGNKVYEVHNDLFGDTELVFSDSFQAEVDVLFLCLGHGDARKFLEANPQVVEPSLKIIDLSQDFRLNKDRTFAGKRFVYGLPEVNREAIREADFIANPGCFATSLQHALLPLAAAGLLPEHLYIQATTGSTGAGQKPGETTHFSWRNNNLSAYKIYTHQHLQEVSETLTGLQPKFMQVSAEALEQEKRNSLLDRAAEHLHFVPLRGDFPRGIFSITQLHCELSEEQVYELYESYYRDHVFTHVSRKNIDLKQVVNTNKSLIHLVKQGEQLVVLNAIDNLLKGASGQAVQNMNLLFGLDERCGLGLKSVGY